MWGFQKVFLNVKKLGLTWWFSFEKSWEWSQIDNQHMAKPLTRLYPLFILTQSPSNKSFTFHPWNFESLVRAKSIIFKWMILEELRPHSQNSHWILLTLLEKNGNISLITILSFRNITGREWSCQQVWIIFCHLRKWDLPLNQLLWSKWDGTRWVAHTVQNGKCPGTVVPDILSLSQGGGPLQSQLVIGWQSLTSSACPRTMVPDILNLSQGGGPWHPQLVPLSANTPVLLI